MAKRRRSSTSYLRADADFHSLSIRDLLEARDAYHVHLTHMDNVIATAIGRYRIRRGDPDVSDPGTVRSRENAPPRTLESTVVRPWSWPCVLVFVREWRTRSELALKPEAVVPPRLYLPDGRVVPTCVLLAEQREQGPAPLHDLSFPRELIGGGYPVFAEVHGEHRVGSLGCLVTDGLAIYALTNRHVAGETGRPLQSVIGGETETVGTSHGKQIGKLAFEEAYRGWAGSRVYANVDAGLVEIGDLSRWTAQVFGIGEVGPLIDLNTSTLSLNLIGCPVRAFGGASGELVGEVQALFYRYKTLGGFDYVADFLIGPRDPKAPVRTRPGDSGTIWFFDDPASVDQATGEARRGRRARRLRPLAMQWGGHTLLAPGGETPLQFALASNLTTVCRTLDVELVRDWNIGHNEYWGKVGHYKIAATACALVAAAGVASLFRANLENIAFPDADIESGKLRRIDASRFVPLADVADLVWRRTRRKDDTNHFADMDQEGTGEFAGKTLLDLCTDPRNVSVDVWNAFYDSLDVGAKRGALPFRVWQIFDEMTGYVRRRRLDEFVCAAGILAHYVGDACQPLHVSHLHHGRPGHDEDRVHSAYETTMLDRYAPEVIGGVNAAVRGRSARGRVADGHAAAVAVVELMRETIEALPPMEVLEAFNARDGRERVPYMWDALGERTAASLARGALCLARLWQAAWAAGGAPRFGKDELGPVSRKALMRLYNNPKFLPAFRLQEMSLAAPG